MHMAYHSINTTQAEYFYSFINAVCADLQNINNALTARAQIMPKYCFGEFLATLKLKWLEISCLYQ